MSSSKPHLLPPSSFLAPAVLTSEPPPLPSSPQDPWVALQQTANEILHLQEVPKHLKENKPRTRVIDAENVESEVWHEQRLGVPWEPAAVSAMPVDFSAYDNIIRRQAVAVEQMQAQLQQQQLQHEKLIGRLENEQLLKDSRYAQHVTELTNEIEVLKKSRETEVGRLVEAKQSQQVEWIRLKTEWEMKWKTKEEAIEEMERKLTTIMSEMDRQQNGLTEEIRLKDQTISDLRHQLNQLKIYLHESESMSKSSDTWKKETQELRNHVQLLENDKKCLITEKELMATRLSALTDILTIQEEQISQGLDDCLTTKKCLLTAWRNKVYELMVQLKSSALASADERQNWINKTNIAEKNCKDLENKCQVLSHVVREKQATVDLKETTAQSLRVDLETARQQLAREKLEHCNSRRLLLDLKELATQTTSRYVMLETSLQQVDAAFKALNKRISFASGRIELLQGQFARKEAILKMDLMDRGEKDKDVVMETTVNQELELCKVELERVTLERNSLSAQVASDAQRLHDLVQSATKKATEEAIDLREKLQSLHEQFFQKSEKLEELNRSLEESHQELSDTRAKVESLKVELAKTQIQNKNEMENQGAELQREFSRQLNEAKREQTKAVVKLRQLERQVDREKERWTSEMEALTNQHHAEVIKLKEKLQMLEKDNNILTATLRQEGLLGKARRQHATPVGTDRLRGNDKNCQSSGDSAFHHIHCSDDHINRHTVMPSGESASYHQEDPITKVDCFAEAKSQRNGRQIDHRSATVKDTLQEVAEDVKYLASQVLTDDDQEEEGGETEGPLERAEQQNDSDFQKTTAAE